ncbi:hypothetical protein J2766_003413 [Agrobacterium tumefaciens]|uniref:Uncharacterized protein n=1 Tax=Agrobacterium tumefaciens TaxID=358 RepID=A0AAW8LRT6_AGRTU|nr:hypothetical protein [Agrobacterium tumefaciens]MBP2566816.1 hypothetical protein [Agrobacterium tumefaciens]MDR6700725.1 hypothetical protein [Agrobacterium tumefaciens]
MNDSALHSFPIFDERPTTEYIDRWRQFISETGAPEDFEGVSTSKPNRSANVILLSDEIRVPTAMRPGGARVPCPLCSPTAPKFGTGRMAYFPDDRATRFIGHRCAKHYLGDNYAEAERIFRIEAKCAEIIALWPKLQSRATEIDAIVNRIYGKARKLTELRNIIDIQAPGFASFLYNDLVAKGMLISTSRDVRAQSHKVLGMEFFSSDFEPETAAAKLLRVRTDVRRPLPNWSISDGEGEASREIVKRGSSAIRRLREFPALRDLIANSAEFFTARNLRALEQWRATGASPFSSLTFKIDGERIEAFAESYAGRYNWSVIFPRDLVAHLPTRDEIDALGLLEVIN